MKIFLLALAGALFLEGAAYALFPRQMRRAMEMFLQEDEKVLRITGLICAIIGFILVFIIARQG